MEKKRPTRADRRVKTPGSDRNLSAVGPTADERGLGCGGTRSQGPFDGTNLLLLFYATSATPTSAWPGRGGSGTGWSSSGCHSRASTTPGATSVSGPKKPANSATEWL